MPNFENTGESAFELATRRTIETDITEAFDAKDIKLVDAKLDIWPYGRERPVPSAEVNQTALARLAVRSLDTV